MEEFYNAKEADFGFFFKLLAAGQDHKLVFAHPVHDPSPKVEKVSTAWKLSPGALQWLELNFPRRATCANHQLVMKFKKKKKLRHRSLDSLAK
jgi:hypothetical protein